MWGEDVPSLRSVGTRSLLVWRIDRDGDERPRDAAQTGRVRACPRPFSSGRGVTFTTDDSVRRPIRKPAECQWRKTSIP